MADIQPNILKKAIPSKKLIQPAVVGIPLIIVSTPLTEAFVFMSEYLKGQVAKAAGSTPRKKPAREVDQSCTRLKRFNKNYAGNPNIKTYKNDTMKDKTNHFEVRTQMYGSLASNI